MIKKHIYSPVILLLIIASRSVLGAEVSYEDDAIQLMTLAAHLYTPVVLQAQDIEDQQLTPEQATDRLRHACLLLEAAAELAPNQPQRWHDLLKLYITDAINDPGRANEARINYDNTGPEHFSIHRDWTRYQYNKYNSREEREIFINQLLNE